MSNDQNKERMSNKKGVCNRLYNTEKIILWKRKQQALQTGVNLRLYSTKTCNQFNCAIVIGIND